MSEGHAKAVAVTHGGVGGPKEHSDACERACEAPWPRFRGRRVLKANQPPRC
jgi:hypothetical protein